MPASDTVRINYAKAAFLMVLFVWGMVGLRNPRAFDFIHGVDLLVHEFGHPFFAVFGNETLQFLGGTLMQLLIPLLFTGYFVLQGQGYAMAATLFWVGQNLVDIAVYVRDAQAQALPLVGGGIHDWNHLLTHWGILGECQGIADALTLLAAAVFLAMLALGLYHSLESTTDGRGNAGHDHEATPGRDTL